MPVDDGEDATGSTDRVSFPPNPRQGLPRSDSGLIPDQTAQAGMPESKSPQAFELAG
jgi:hypothetical protein